MKAALPALLLLLAACEAERPMARAGEALDRTGTRVDDAMGRAAQNTGAAVQRAGDRLRDRSAPLPPPGLSPGRIADDPPPRNMSNQTRPL